jgi:hypothetical protein
MNQDTNKTEWFEYIYFFMVVIYAAMAVPFTSSMNGYTGSPLGFALPVVMTAILLVRNKVNFKNSYFLTILIVYTLWALAQFLINNRLNITYSFLAYYNITLAYIIISVFKTKIFELYEDIVTKLSIVAIVGWLFMITAPNVIGALVDVLKMPSNDIYILRGNILIFSMTNSDVYQADELLGLTRNSGFSWEPGRYATMLVVALFFNMARTKFSFSKNRAFWILFFALLTTQSTTGFISLALIAIMFLLNKNTDHKIFYLALLIPLAIFAVSLPFIGDKLTSLSDSETTKSKIDDDLKAWEILGEGDMPYTPQRFDGLSFEFLNFINDPILGYGHDAKDSFVNTKIASSLVLSNGLLKVFARFGIIIGVLFYFALYKSSKWFSDFYDIKGGVLYMFLFMSISISYDFTLIPFFFAVTLFGLFADKDIKYNREEEENILPMPIYPFVNKAR